MTKQITHLLDYTRLISDDDEAAMINFLTAANAAPIAAVCVYPRWLALAKRMLANSPVAIATVVNFPDGQQSLDDTLQQIQNAQMAGATEIDLVIPYQQYSQQNSAAVLDYVKQCRAACQVTLKAIIETGELHSAQFISQACKDMLLANVDYIKTSTGKTLVGATPAAVEIILGCLSKQREHRTGIKISGGIRTIEQANIYCDLISSTMGQAWLTPQHVRFGCSTLL